MDWDRAECRNHDPDLFFPTSDPVIVYEVQIEAAKAVCRHCPIMGPCRRWALDTAQRHGVWGGLSPAERRRLGLGKCPPSQSRQASGPGVH